MVSHARWSVDIEGCVSVCVRADTIDADVEAVLLRVAQRLLHIGLCTTPSAAGGGHAEEAHVGTSATR